jgi:hypothetical protein
MALPEVGKYTAKLAGKIIIAEGAEQEGLQAFMPVEVCDGEQTGARITAIRTIVSKAGAVQINEVEKLKEIFGIDGTLNSIFALMDSDHPDVRFEIDVQDEEYQGAVKRKVKWVNSLGGGGMKMPEPADRRSVLTKYGSKFRALAGGAPVKPATPPATPKPVTPPKPKAPPVPQTGPVSTMEECWEEFNKLNPNSTQDDLTKIWFETQKELVGKSDNNLTRTNGAKSKRRSLTTFLTDHL